LEVLLAPDPVSFAARLVVALLFAGVFVFLYRESRNLYFQYWIIGWLLLAAALLCRLGWMSTGRALFLAPAGLSHLAFAVSLVFSGAAVHTRPETRLTSLGLLVPAAGSVVYIAGVALGFRGAQVLLSILLACAFGSNFVLSRRLWTAAAGSGRKLFCVSLGAGAALSVHDALVFSASLLAPAAAARYLVYYDLYYLVLETLLAFSAMLMWMEAQNEQLRRANEELALSRQQLAQSAQLDPLTGLLNRAALNQACEADAGQHPSGIVAVLDLDNFKDINDSLGHLTGDEVLASIGGLIRGSIRRTDQAWRWGGDEFVILFQDQTRESADERLAGLAERLQRFQVRGRGALPIRVSWGTAEIGSSSLRQALEEADNHMYMKKKEKSSKPKLFGE